eukprot:gene7484-8072_t
MTLNKTKHPLLAPQEETTLIKSPSNLTLSPSRHRNRNFHVGKVNNISTQSTVSIRALPNLFVFTIFSLAVLILFIIASNFLYTEKISTNHLRDNSRDPFAFLPSSLSLAPEAPYLNLTVILFGDSLLNVPFTEYQLDYKLKSLLPPCFRNITILNKGRGGNKVRDLRQRLTNDVLLLQPNVVFIHFDSDISDQDNDFLRLNSTQLAYKEDYDFILHMMTSYKIPHIAIAGPGLLGEGPVVRRSKFRGKEDLLDKYRLINQRLAGDYKIPYIDIRKAYQEALPPFWIFSSGFVTTDGEHPNDRGSLIIAQHFAAQVNKWYSC